MGSPKYGPPFGKMTPPPHHIFYLPNPLEPGPDGKTMRPKRPPRRPKRRPRRSKSASPTSNHRRGWPRDRSGIGIWPPRASPAEDKRRYNYLLGVVKKQSKEANIDLTRRWATGPANFRTAWMETNVAHCVQRARVQATSNGTVCCAHV